MTRSPICYTAGCMAQRCLCLKGMMRLARLAAALDFDNHVLAKTV